MRASSVRPAMVTVQWTLSGVAGPRIRDERLGGMLGAGEELWGLFVLLLGIVSVVVIVMILLGMGRLLGIRRRK